MSELKLVYREEGNFRYYQMIVDGKPVTNVLAVEVKEDLSSIGIQEHRVRVEFSIEKKYVR